MLKSSKDLWKRSKSKSHRFRGIYLHISSFSWPIFEFIIFLKILMFFKFRKLKIHSNGCFLMTWRSRDHSRLILDRFGKIIFFTKFFIFLRNFGRPCSNFFSSSCRQNLMQICFSRHPVGRICLLEIFTKVCLTKLG